MLNARPVIRPRAGVTVFQALPVQPSITGNHRKFDGRLTAAAKKQSEGELRMLEEDILKRVDVFSFYARYERRL